MNVAPSSTPLPHTNPDVVDAPTAKSRKWLLWGFYVVLALLVGVVAYIAIGRPITVLPRITVSPGYLFYDAGGEVVTSEDLRGAVTLYSFTYGGCERDGCGQSVADIGQAYEVLQAVAPADIPLALVTISLDPERDDTAVLTSLLQPEPEPNQTVPWHFLRHDPTRTKAVVGGGFGLFYTPRPVAEGNPDEYFIRFDPRYVLVDELGIIRAYYHQSVPDPAILARDVNLILTEARNSNGLGRLGYEAAHLFVCYP
jgi:protein SCO1